MKKTLLISCLTGLALLMSSCASIVSKSSYPISINSSPSEAKIIITDANGVQVYSGNTPATVKLKASAKFFKRALYHVKFEKEGYETKTVPIHFKVDGWYWGNILFGGVIGLLIVDPATGAMYKLKTEFLNETLSKSPTANIQKNQLHVMDINNIPDSWKNHLVALKK
ncbi:PEGA domain-containing protein [Marinifilum fragile]|uniref:PEGA domain-containing protein n=1 Tax=Marinifilum fragile TaxID=570161 RepID=UPI0006CFC7F8|nr:PEGA domain-containing protein [Marinifilum fragile]